MCRYRSGPCRSWAAGACVQVCSSPGSPDSAPFIPAVSARPWTAPRFWPGIWVCRCTRMKRWVRTITPPPAFFRRQSSSVSPMSSLPGPSSPCVAGRPRRRRFHCHPVARCRRHLALLPSGGSAHLAPLGSAGQRRRQLLPLRAEPAPCAGELAADRRGGLSMRGRTGLGPPLATFRRCAAAGGDCRPVAHSLRRRRHMLRSPRLSPSMRNRSARSPQMTKPMPW